MVAICVCIALIGAIAAALVANAVIGKDDDGAASSDRITLGSAKVDGTALLTQPLLTVNGKTSSLGAVTGTKPVLVNLWQQSCAPCVKEMPLLDEVHRTEERVDVVGVNTQDPPDRARQMAAKTGITYPWLRDPTGDFFYASKGTGLPRTVLIEPSGVVLATKTGEFSSRAELERWLDDHLS